MARSLEFREWVTCCSAAGHESRAAFDTADPFTEVSFSATGMLAPGQDAEVTLWEAV
jgi:hypothetical protein